MIIYTTIIDDADETKSLTMRMMMVVVVMVTEKLPDVVHVLVDESDLRISFFHDKVRYDREQVHLVQTE